MSSDRNRSIKGIADRLSGLFERAWLTAFGIQGFRSTLGMRKIGFPGGQRVCLVAPHPDDEILGCGGTLAYHLAAGDVVEVIYVTDGRLSRALGPDPEAMAARRRAEAAAAAQAWGFRVKWLGFREGEWAAEVLADRLSFLWTVDSPDVLYVPSWLDFHPEHIRSAAGLADALPDCKVRIYAVQVPLTSQLANRVVDISDCEDKLQSSAAFYASQAGNFPRAMRQRRYNAARYRNGTLAEAFWEVTPAQYRRLGKKVDGLQQNFCGLRYWAFSDPLAYLVGRAARAAVKEAVCGS
jgi:LmbE family N-acetylglucosaminyl deacetylase